MGTISQDHAKLDSDIIADAIKLLVEVDPSIKVKSIIIEVLSRINYTTLPVWLKAMCMAIEEWVLAFDGSHRWDCMTTDLVECINSILRGICNLPMTTIVKSSFYRLNELFTRKSVEVHEYVRRTGNIVVNQLNRHNEIFKMSEIFKAYSGKFVPMGDRSAWPRYDGANVIDNWTLKHVTKGRPKSTCYLNEMDLRDMHAPRRCTLFGREGHSCSRCSQRAGPSSIGGQ
ncbi:hypothetical protein Ahy_A10g049561 [Arachis hypogaea]|uniref:Uncharacterized protein n=1 Tax=Arachis hypogaea TaxID=3818 RepID=A0A445B7F8_ARAHY|nr:hypothetical protein Ahy_A10g049561 [Arachis hypogaea]